MNWKVFNAALNANDVDDAETIALVQDYVDVFSSLLQSMPVIGAWLETRVFDEVSKRVGAHLRVSGQTQIIDPRRPSLRSRSWDVVIYDPSAIVIPLPPAATARSGPPLIPIEACRAVIDTKTSFSNVRE